MDKYVGKKLDGRYDIRELIGIGGMANVYRCYDTIDDREVAIKILKDEYLNNLEFIRRFKNESKAIAVLSHPNIVKVFDVSFGDMIQYIVMEYIDGITLKEYIQQQGVLTWKETVHLISQVLQALSHAHSKGVVHRDIKPQNMMLLSDGTIKVTDFGIARFSNNTRTMTEQAIGSVHYIAPEQAKGDITDGRTDIYSLGVMMYEMLTGKLPYDGDNAVSVALMHLQLTPDSPCELNSDIPEGLEEITLKAMQKQPSDRYQSAQDMLSDIERFRLNPSVRFEYKYFFDKQPTKYVDAINKVRSNRTEAEESSKDDDNVRHSSAFAVILGVVIAAFLAFTVCFIIGLTRQTSTEELLEVEIPNFIGMNVNEVMNNSDYKFKFEYEYIYNKDKEINEIVDQTPLPSSKKKVKENATITLSVNSKQGEGEIPYVYGDDQNTAISKLKDANFIYYEIRTVIDDSMTPGIVKNTYPAMNSTTDFTDTVYLYVVGETADTRKSVPYVIGFSKEEAESMITDAGFEVEFKTVKSEKPKDTVIMQTPVSGKLNAKSVIKVSISDGEPQTSVQLTIELPKTLADNTKMVVRCEDDASEPIYLNSNTPKKISVSVTGTGIKNVEITLNDNLYAVYSVNFTKKTSELIEYYWVEETTTAPALVETQATTEIQTEATE
ncbi:MAG: Stk1 family PASTA domain-containing Ser/Thr kinase [Clostridia bacterium]|nr:Stk1 family PASTA domain-containing Ser/Thr kinase [Clostridia bacterium]